MSDQGYTAAEDQDDDGGIFCQNCSPTTRKLGYYITFLAGVLTFGFGIVSLIAFSVAFLIAGSLLVLFCPLWIKSPAALCRDLKNPLRLSSCILFLACLAATIVCFLVLESDLLKVIPGIFLAIAGIWYFLSFFKNGQKACISCIKTCCGKSSEEQSGEASAPAESA